MLVTVSYPLLLPFPSPRFPLFPLPAFLSPSFSPPPLLPSLFYYFPIPPGAGGPDRGRKHMGRQFMGRHRQTQKFMGRIWCRPWADMGRQLPCTPVTDGISVNLMTKIITKINSGRHDSKNFRLRRYSPPMLISMTSQPPHVYISNSTD